MANPVVHFEISGKDGAALGAYYEKLFGWKPKAVPGMPYWMVERPEDGTGIGGGIASSQDGSPLATFYVQVDDPQAALDQAVALGGSVRMPVMSIPGMVTIALFSDPEGNVIGLVGSQTPEG
jgi:predicted enzyme related to lactoylglutathione lyase